MVLIKYHFEYFIHFIYELLDEIEKTGHFGNNYQVECKNLVNLLFESIIKYSYDEDPEGKLDDLVKNILNRIYSKRTSKIIIENLYLLSIANPQVVMDFIREDYKNKEHTIY